MKLAVVEIANKSVQLNSQEIVIAKYVSPDIHPPIKVELQRIPENCYGKTLYVLY